MQPIIDLRSYPISPRLYVGPTCRIFVRCKKCDWKGYRGLKVRMTREQFRTGLYRRMLRQYSEIRGQIHRDSCPKCGKQVAILFFTGSPV